VASTGRLSTSDPNLQNIPIRTELGRRIRHAFVAAPGCVLVAADYSQIELRLLAHFSGDEALAAAFRDGADVHARTAARIHGCAVDAVTPAMRAAAKTVNFGVLYGMGPRGLADRLGIDVEAARRFIADYFDRYPAVRRTTQAMIDSARATGYAVTLLGRRLALPEITSPNPGRRAFAERVAVNAPIQGSAADIIKVAMVRAEAALRAARLEARMILQVHDELVFDVPEAEVDTVRASVRAAMEAAVELTVPLVADIGVGRNWAEAH
jgi:DNA polymerase-1